MRTPLLAGGVLSHRGGRWLGGVTEWLMVADCKSAGLTPYVGSNPTPTTQADGRTDGTGGRISREMQWRMGSELKGSRGKPSDCPARPPDRPAGVAQLVEHQPSKLRVAGSSPVARFARMDGWTGGQTAG